MYFRKFSIQYCVGEKLLPTIEPQSSAPIYFNFGTLVMDIIPEYLSISYILTLRRLMSHIYGAPILDVSRSHTTTQHSR